MTNNAPEKRSTAIRLKYTETADALTVAQQELNRASRALSDARVNQALSGEVANPKLCTAGAKLKERVSELEYSLQPLETALSLVSTEEARAEVEAGIARAAALRVEYADAVKTLVAAVLKADEAAAVADAIYGKFPITQWGHTDVQRVSANIHLGSVEGLAAFTYQVCQANHIDAVPVGDLGRSRYEHGKAHEAWRGQQIEASRSDVWKELDRLQKGGAPVEASFEYTIRENGPRIVFKGHRYDDPTLTGAAQ